LQTETLFESSVTAPLSASKLPDTLAPVDIETLASATMVPANWVPAAIVAELPTCQNTLAPLHVAPASLTTTAALAGVISVDPIWKIQGPSPVRNRVPVIWADVSKQETPGGSEWIVDPSTESSHRAETRSSPVM
jgi:hypothetical protein